MGTSRRSTAPPAPRHLPATARTPRRHDRRAPDGDPDPRAPRPRAARARRRPARPGAHRPGAVVVDGTLGMGGHTEAMLERCPQARLIGLDRDREALALARRAAGPVRRPVHWSTRSTTSSPTRRSRRLAEVHRARHALRPRGLLPAAGRAPTAGSPTPGRPAGHADGPGHGHHRRRVLNTYAVGDLTRVLRDVRRGALRLPHRPAIVASATRSRSPPRPGSSSCSALAIPAARRTGGHPAKRTFQALRIEVNEELGVLGARVPAAIEARRRRADRRAHLPLAGGPDRQARFAARRLAPHAARAAGGAARARRLPAAAHPWRRGARRRRSWPPTPGPPRPGCAPPNACPKGPGLSQPPPSGRRAHRQRAKAAAPTPRQLGRPAAPPRGQRPSSPCASLLLLGASSAS